MSELENQLGFHFTEPHLLEEALTHSSMVQGARRFAFANERLEFLGDAVLGLVVTEFLWRRFPNWDEGQLTRARASIVNEDALAQLAQRFDLGRLLHLGLGEQRSAGYGKPSILADAIEAVFGAVYLDAGLEKVRHLIHEHLLAGCDWEAAQEFRADYKSTLQELAQDRLRATPRYEVVEEEGLPHNRMFLVQCVIGQKIYGEGRGSSKKRAAQIAAAAAIEKITQAGGLE